MAIKREDLISSVLNKVKKTFNDNKGFVQQGRLTAQPIRNAIQNWQQKPSNQLVNRAISGIKQSPVYSFGNDVVTGIKKSPVPQFGNTLGMTAASPIVSAQNKRASQQYSNNINTALKMASQAKTPEERQRWMNLAGSSQSLQSGQANQFQQQYNKSGLQIAGEGLGVAATVIGGPKMALKTTLTQSLLGGVLNKAMGGSFGEGFGTSLGYAPAFQGVASLTNPYLSKAMQFSPVKGEIAKRGTAGLFNVAQGAVQDVATGQKTNLASAGIDFGLGVIGGKTQFDSPNVKVKGIFKNAKKIDEFTAAEVGNLQYKIEKGIPLKKKDLIDLNRIWDRYIGKETRKGTKFEQPEFKIRELVNEIDRQYIPNLSMGFVGKQEPIKTGGEVKPPLIDKKVDLGFEPNKTDLEIKPVEQIEQKLPWEEPEYVAKNGGLKTQDSPILKTGTIKQELNQLKSKSDVKSQPIISPELKSDIKKVENIAPKKVNLLDYFRTPDRVLKKIGLQKESDLIRQQYNKYLDELPLEIGKISKWHEQVKNTPDANKRLFQYLDGQDVQLNKNELKVAGEMKKYLAEWADKLDLPYDKRVTNYITHIFEKDFIKKDFDDDLAKIISEKVSSSVYDPFTQERLGKQGYIEDVFRALDAYTKRAVRKYNMDPALEKLSQASDKLPLESWKYVKSFADRVNLRPTEIDTMIDNLVKQSPIGYKLGQRPVTGTSKKLRQAVYRGTLGLNFGSALRNLTQGANTYAKLGEKYTGIGYVRALKEIASGGDELTTSGVLRDNFIQDRQLSSSKKLMQKLDEGLFSLFNLAEKINRGSAYFGAKAKFLNEGLNEKEAISKAVDLVRDTQFTFGSVDTPVVMQSDLAKTLGQFQSFNIKQTEFLGEMLSGKDVAGLLRWVGANALMMFTVGNLIGIDVQDIIPFGGVFTGETKLGQTPPIQLGTDLYKAGINAPDKYGNVSEDNIIGRIGGALSKNAPAFVPGGVQIKKTIQGIKAVNEEGSFSKSGRLQYPIEKTPENYLRASVFGKSNLPAAREYFDNDGSVLGEKQTEFYKQSTDKQGVYKSFMDKRQEEKAIEVAKEEIKNTGATQKINGKILYQNEAGDIKTIDIDKVSNLPEQTNYQRALKQKEAFKLIDDVMDNLSGDEQISALNALGVSAEDATYYNTARQENYLKSIYVEEEIMGMIQQGQNKDQILNTLAGMRRAVNEKVLLTDGVINDLVDKNIISYQDGKNLKNIDKDLKTKSLKAKKAKKPKKISLSSKKFTASRKKYNPLKVKTSSTKTRFKPPKYVKADLRTSFNLL